MSHPKPLTNQPPSRLGGLDFIRGIAALHVVYNHIGGKFQVLLPSLRQQQWLDVKFSVSVFFLISGFVVMMIADRKVRQPSPANLAAFIKDRLLRLYPTYIVAFLMMVAMVVGAKLTGVQLDREFRWETLPAEAMMILAWDHTLVWNAPSWSVNVLSWVLVIVFPVMFLILRQCRNRFTQLALIVGLLAVYAEIHSHNEWTALYYASRVLFPFAIGMTLFTFWRTLRTPSPWLVNTLVIAGVLAYYSNPMGWNVGLSGYTLKLLTLSILVAFVTAAAFPNSLFSKLGRIQPFKMLGQLSFCIYLSHVIIQRALAVLIPAEPFVHSSRLVRLSLVVAHLIIILLGAAAFHFWVERPFERRRKGRPKEAQTQAGKAPEPALR